MRAIVRDLNRIFVSSCPDYQEEIDVAVRDKEGISTTRRTAGFYMARSSLLLTRRALSQFLAVLQLVVHVM